MTALLTHNHIYTENLNLPDDVNTGDIITAIADAIKRFDYSDCVDPDIFEIVLKDGRTFLCYESVDVFNKWCLYVQNPDYEFEWIADFRM
mgnify:CR=1 FL=1